MLSIHIEKNIVDADKIVCRTFPTHVEGKPRLRHHDEATMKF